MKCEKYHTNLYFVKYQHHYIYLETDFHQHYQMMSYNKTLRIHLIGKKPNTITYHVNERIKLF